MKWQILWIVLIVAGCALEEKGEIYSRIGEMVLIPERVEVHYRREDGTMTFREERCTGELCRE